MSIKIETKTFHIFSSLAGGNSENIDFEYFKLKIKYKGLKTYYCLYSKNNVLVHKSVVFRFNLLSIQLGLFLYNVIGECWTNDEYRGLGLYGKMIQYIIRKNSKKKYVLFVEKKNGSSIKGLQKIGLPIIKTVEISRFLKVFSWYRVV